MNHSRLYLAIALIGIVTGTSFYAARGQQKIMAGADASTAPLRTAITEHNVGYDNLRDWILGLVHTSEPTTSVNQQIRFGGVGPHHVPTALPLLVDYYRELHRTNPDIETFVILGPDHRDRSHHSIVISEARFQTVFGPIQTNSSLAEKLIQTGNVYHEEDPFENEHAIGSQLLILHQFYPQAKVVPILFRSSSTRAEATALGEDLGKLLPPTAFVMASVDFSHYLPSETARELDQQSAQQLEELSLDETSRIHADSPQSLIALTAAMLTRQAHTFSLSTVKNSADFTGQHERTTGYVVGSYE